MQHEVLTQRAAEPCQQVMMLSTTMRNWWSSSMDGRGCDSIHRDYFRRGDYALYLCPIKQISVLVKSFYHLRKQNKSLHIIKWPESNRPVVKYWND